MFCTKCGKELPGQTPFCPDCGTDLRTDAVAEPAKSQGFLGLSVNKLITLIITVVCIAALFISYICALNTSFEKLPLVAMIMGDEADSFQESKDHLTETLDEAEEIIEEAEDKLSKKDLKKVKKLLQVSRKFARSASIRNIQNFVAVAEDTADIEINGNTFSFHLLSDKTENVMNILNILSTVILICMLVGLVFSACGGFLKIQGLVITGLIFSVIYGLIFCGILFVVLFVAVHIALYIYIGKVKAEANA